MDDGRSSLVIFFKNQHWISLIICVFLFSICVGCGGGSGSSHVFESPVTFIGIGWLPGDNFSQANAVSADGLVVVGLSKSSIGNTNAFRWSSGNGMKSLGQLQGGTFTNAKAVSSDGAIIIGDANNQSTSSTIFRWSDITGIVQLQPILSSTLCAAGGVSGDGKTIVGTCLVSGNTGIRWTESAGMISLGQFGNGGFRSSNALAISSDGSIIVGIGHPVLNGAVLWDSAGVASILGKVEGDISAAANAVSRDGSVVAGYSTQPSGYQRAFHWTKQTGMTAIFSASDLFSDVVATGVSGNGHIIVGWGNTLKGETAFIWDEFHGARRLEDILSLDYQTTIPGWTLSRATGISDDGSTIVGYGINPDGNVEGWKLKISI